jgi:hypothetical protein
LMERLYDGAPLRMAARRFLLPPRPLRLAFNWSAGPMALAASRELKENHVPPAA